MKISLGNICAKKSVSLASTSKIATGPGFVLVKGSISRFVSTFVHSSSTPSSSQSAFDSSSLSVCPSSLETSSTSISELTPSYSFLKPPKLFLFVIYDPKHIVDKIHRLYAPKKSAQRNLFIGKRVRGRLKCLKRCSVAKKLPYIRIIFCNFFGTVNFLNYRF